MPNKLPLVINNFNVYKQGNQLIGISGEIKLPEFENVTAEVSGAGILGTFEENVIGMFNSMEMEIPFRILDDDIFKFMDPTENVDLTLRASQQLTETGSGDIDYRGMRVVIRGKQKKFDAGKLEQGEQMDSAVTLEVIYLLIEIDGKNKIELDKLNFVYKVNGKDILAKVRKQC